MLRAKAGTNFHRFPPLDFGEPEPADQGDRSAAEYVEKIKHSPLFATISSVHPGIDIRLAPVDVLVTPLVVIDYEYLDTLKPELPGKDPLDAVRLAFPETIAIQVKAVSDPSLREVTFVTNEKSLTVSPMQIRQTPEGTEVKFVVASNISAIIVGNFAGRLVLLNGIHRAFLLAKEGFTKIPCFFVEESTPVPVVNLTAYPTFTPNVLMQPRPPLLIDFLNDALCIQAPLQRTNKVIRIAATETIIPID